MPLSFSSFGDLVAVLQLAWQFRAALNDATGASADIRALIHDIDSFTRALRHLKASTEARNTPLEPSVANGIALALTACHDILTIFMGKVSAFRKRTSRASGALAWRRYWGIAAWSVLGGRQEVDALRARLSSQLSIIHTYLALSQSNNQGAIQGAVRHQGVTLEQLYSSVLRIQMRFDVGIPSFRFFDRRNGQYFRPFARTSITRLLQIFDAIGAKAALRLDGGKLLCSKGFARGPPWDPVQAEEFVTVMWLDDYDTLPGSTPLALPLACCVFKERAFGEWQVLLGAGSFLLARRSHLETLRLLAERKHAVGSPCTCDSGPCGRTYDSARRQTRTVFSTAHILLDRIVELAHIRPRQLHDCFLAALRLELSAEIDPTYVQKNIVPLLKMYIECQQPPILSLLYMLRLAPRAMDLGGQSSAYMGKYLTPQSFDWECRMVPKPQTEPPILGIRSLHRLI